MNLNVEQELSDMQEEKDELEAINRRISDMLVRL